MPLSITSARRRSPVGDHGTGGPELNRPNMMEVRPLHRRLAAAIFFLVHLVFRAAAVHGFRGRAAIWTYCLLLCPIAVAVYSHYIRLRMVRAKLIFWTSFVIIGLVLFDTRLMDSISSWFYNDLVKPAYEGATTRLVRREVLDLTLPDLSKCHIAASARTSVILVPFPAFQTARVLAMLGSWTRKGSRPCAQISASHTVDLTFQIATSEARSPRTLSAIRQFVASNKKTFRCFNKVQYRELDWPDRYDNYQCSPTFCGPPRNFYESMFSQELNCQHSAVLFLEPDNRPVRDCWLSTVSAEMSIAVGRLDYWFRLPLSQPGPDDENQPLGRSMLNGGGIFRLGEPQFLRFLRRVAELGPGIPYDAAISNYIKTGRTKDYLHVAHKMQMTGLVMGDMQEYFKSLYSRPEVVFLHVHDVHNSKDMGRLMQKADEVWGRTDRNHCLQKYHQ